MDRSYELQVYLVGSRNWATIEDDTDCGRILQKRDAARKCGPKHRYRIIRVVQCDPIVKERQEPPTE